MNDNIRHKYFIISVHILILTFTNKTALGKITFVTSFLPSENKVYTYIHIHTYIHARPLFNSVNLTQFHSSCLGNLVQLLDQLMLSHLVMIARDSVTRFVYETMRTSSNSSREALFEVKLIFSESGMTCHLKYFLSTLNISLIYLHHFN